MLILNCNFAVLIVQIKWNLLTINIRDISISVLLCAKMSYLGQALNLDS